MQTNFRQMAAHNSGLTQEEMGWWGCWEGEGGAIVEGNTHVKNPMISFGTRSQDSQGINIDKE